MSVKTKRDGMNIRRSVSELQARPLNSRMSYSWRQGGVGLRNSQLIAVLRMEVLPEFLQGEDATIALEHECRKQNDIDHKLVEPNIWPTHQQ